ncbi:MAG TPA: hypothetical protein VN962_10110, partial [Polyangia bacterium]|nr:hypothetical protein [Polyangia bacterium]
GLTVSRRRPPKPAPPLSARREIAPPPHHPSAERGFPRTHERAPVVPPKVTPVLPPVVVTEAALGPLVSPDAVEPAPAVARRRARAAPAAPAPIPNIDGAGIWIPAE